jgi:protein-disulfide isomerase/uncharacterized membrane protein
MTKKIYLLALFITLSLLLQSYLTNTHFQLHYGDQAGSSICNIGEKFNCEAVTASKYSKFLNIPLAVWGLGLNITLFLLLIGLLISDNHKIKWQTVLALFLILSAAGSVVMAIISLTLMTVYCLFCILLYILSFLQLYTALKLDLFKNFKAHLLELIDVKNISYGVLVVALLFPISSLFINAKMKRNFGGDRFEKQIEFLLSDWKSDTNSILFANTPATLVLPSKDQNSKFEIVEFADFLCGHCQKASKVFKTFLATHSATLRFYVFPLDQTCRTETSTQTGPSCYLAKSTYCAEKQGKGWKLHDWIFDHQKQLMTTLDNIKLQVKAKVSDLGLTEADWTTCVESEETHKAIVQQSQFAENLNITGTPTVFINGKKLKGGQVLDVLKQAYDISR